MATLTCPPNADVIADVRIVSEIKDSELNDSEIQERIAGINASWSRDERLRRAIVGRISSQYLFEMLVGDGQKACA